jgi:hypothetical protein
MMVKEEKKPRKETWLEFSPWEHVDYKKTQRNISRLLKG